jgi:hypothetical protein
MVVALSDCPVLARNLWGVPLEGEAIHLLPQNSFVCAIRGGVGDG